MQVFPRPEVRRDLEAGGFAVRYHSNMARHPANLWGPAGVGRTGGTDFWEAYMGDEVVAVFQRFPDFSGNPNEMDIITKNPVYKSQLEAIHEKHYVKKPVFRVIENKDMVTGSD